MKIIETFKVMSEAILKNIIIENPYIDGEYKPVYKKYKISIEEIKEEDSIYIDRLKELYTILINDVIENKSNTIDTSKLYFILKELKDTYGWTLDANKNWAEIEDTKETFLQKINNCIANQRVKLFNYRYTDFVIDYEENYGFSWCVNRNYKISGSSWSITPLVSNNKVKFFKTFEGAKRNIINYFGLNEKGDK